MLAAVDRQGRSGDETCIVAYQKLDCARYVLGVTKTPDRNSCHDFFEYGLRDGHHHIGGDVTRGDGINGNTLGRALLGQGLGESVNAAFSRGVVDLAILPGLAVHRADVDDAPETACAHTLDDTAAHVEARPQISAHDVVPLVVVHLVHGAVTRDTRVVNQNFNRTYLFLYPAYGLSAGIQIAHIKFVNCNARGLGEGAGFLIVTAIIGNNRIACFF